MKPAATIGRKGAVFASPISASRPVAGGPRLARRHAGVAGAHDVASYQAFRMRIMVARAGMTTESEASPAPAAAAHADAEPPISVLDIRVGKILKCEPHPDAEALYVEQIDVGEAEPRTIVSGLVKYVPVDQMQDRMAIILCNLKPRNMRGIKSNGMVLCASDDKHERVEPLRPAEGATPGTRVWFGEGGQTQAAAETANRVDKKKMWEALQPHLKTDASRVAGCKGLAMQTANGPVTADTLANGSIS